MDVKTLSTPCGSTQGIDMKYKKIKLIINLIIIYIKKILCQKN